MTTKPRNRVITTSDQYPLIRKAKVNTEEEEETTLCLCFQSESDTYRWYNLDPQIHPQPKPLSLLCEIPDATLPFGFRCVVLGSKIYLIGGVETIYTVNDEEEFPSSNVLVIDTRYRENNWGEGIRMIGGKAWPVVAALDGKIYVLGSGLAGKAAQPWAELFDPIKKSWSALRDPPDVILQASTNLPTQHVVFEEGKKILASYKYIGMYQFDTTTEDWEQRPDMCIGEKFAIYGKCVVVEGVLYMCVGKELYAYNLVEQKHPQSAVQVYGLEGVTDSIKFPYCDESPGFLSHLGKGKLCLVWSFGRKPERKHINCLKFRVEKRGDKLHAVGLVRYSSYVENVYDLLHCCAIKRDIPLDTSTASSSSDPGVPGTVSGAHKTSQAIRHACRVYVGGLPLNAERKAIENLFREKINSVEGANESDVVVDVYIHHKKNYAIVELSSMKRACIAMTLKDVTLEGKELRIRRPHDYNCEVAARLDPSLPNDPPPKEGYKIGQTCLEPLLMRLVTPFID